MIQTEHLNKVKLGVISNTSVNQWDKYIITDLDISYPDITNSNINHEDIIDIKMFLRDKAIRIAASEKIKEIDKNISYKNLSIISEYSTE